jgi:crossover junction endodeoxyribonuclease RuvC
MVILGIDPGFQFSGFGIIKKENNKIILLESGYLKLNPTKHLSVRVHEFYDHFDAKIKKWGVTDVSLETSFLGKNAQNFLKLGYLRGILYLLASQNKLNIHEFSPTEVKKSITGFGGAQKDQVARVVLQLFPGLLMPAKNDVTDAIAVTLCGAWKHKNLHI